MGERELREKYGGKLAKAMNRAIRAEIEGGNAALDRLTQLAGPARHSGWVLKNGNPTPEAVAYEKHRRDVVGKMESLIRRKWGIEEEQAAPKRQSTARPRRNSGPARRGKPKTAARSSPKRRKG